MKIFKVTLTIFSCLLFLLLFLSLPPKTNAQFEVNFGINNLSPWIQTKDSDIRIDSPNSVISNGSPIFTDPIPGSPSDSPAQFCGAAAYSNAYASLQGSGGTPGIIFSGSNDYSFGAGGLASITSTNPPYGWVVGGSYPDEYNIQLAKKTSYDYILAKATQGGLTPIDITNDTSDKTAGPVNHCGVGGTGDCKLDSGTALPHGLYIVPSTLSNGDLVLSASTVDSSGQPAYTFPSGQNYVILVPGNLKISAKIHVPVGSTAVFIVKGNITVSSTIGESNPAAIDPVTNQPPSDIEGMYSADGDFIIAGGNTCPTPDLRLNLAGNIVTGAGGTGGAFKNNRDLCAGDALCPVFYVSSRPDFILNLPTLMRFADYTWQEVAP